MQCVAYIATTPYQDSTATEWALSCRKCYVASSPYAIWHACTQVNDCHSTITGTAFCGVLSNSRYTALVGGIIWPQVPQLYELHCLCYTACMKSSHWMLSKHDWHCILWCAKELRQCCSKAVPYGRKSLYCSRHIAYGGSCYIACTNPNA